jgi:riboflavin synthase alpha subunit
MTYKIKKYSKFRLEKRGIDVYTIHKGDNNCPDISIGDEIDIDGKVLTIKEMESFKKSFGIEGENVAVIVEPINDIN